MTFKRISFLAALVATSALAAGPISQKPFGREHLVSDFTCDLPPALSPDRDGLQSADQLFSSKHALLEQVKRHQAIVRVPSISYDDLGSFDEDERWAPFYDLHRVLAETYPNLHKRASLEKINTLGLVYTIQGSESSLKPILLAAHQDVVPVPDATTWKYPPFEAKFDGEFLWGRGASDDKNSLTALLSAVETLLGNPNWTPRRTIILAFGFDEECSGYRGAGSIGNFLTERYGDDGIALILDEGGLGLEAIGDDALYALPSVMEKGHVDIWLQLHVRGGHSSIPFPHTGIGIISEIVTALESHPYEPELLKGGPVYNHLVCLERHSSDGTSKLSDLLKKGDLKGLTKEFVKTDPNARFLIQTSQSVDIIEGGAKINAMPEVVTLGVNYRVAPQDSTAEVQHNIVKYIDSIVKKYNLAVEAFEGDEEYEQYVSAATSEHRTAAPSYEVDYDGTLVLRAEKKFNVTPISPTRGAIWDVFSGTIQHTFAFDGGKVVPVGEVMTGNTDTRHYLNLSPNIYRWTPTRDRGAESIHTVDEKVRMSSHIEVVKFYYNLVRNFDAADV
ncbi:hypothetical protein G7046_g4632 [Stylonectria norvegica]|nr:hypothetical protein G7046_g4632 [Stylonectria norvegica]